MQEEETPKEHDSAIQMRMFDEWFLENEHSDLKKGARNQEEKYLSIVIEVEPPTA